MFIAFLILILIQFHSYSNYSVFDDGDEHKNSVLVINANDSTVTAVTASTKIIFKVPILTNSKKPNLKVNVFDKMLSDEMLSIKQQIYEKDATNPSTMQINTNRRVPTPLLELQQRWPIETVQSSKEKKLDFERHMQNIDKDSVDESDEHKVNYEIDLKNTSKERVLELRSLSHKLHKIETSSKNQHTTKKCTCANGNTNMGRHSDRSTQKHRDNVLHYREDHDTFHSSSNHHSVCTRTVSTNSLAIYPFYVTYSPYFIGTVADYTNYYYHPGVINDLKRPKNHKDRKHKKPVMEEIDEDESKELYDEYSQLYQEEITKRTRKHKDRSKTNYEFKIIYETTNEPETNSDFNKVQVVSKDKFVEEIVDDLKMYYNEAVIKDCYCSSCSFKLGLQIVTFVYFFQLLM